MKKSIKKYTVTELQLDRFASKILKRDIELKSVVLQQTKIENSLRVLFSDFQRIEKIIEDNDILRVSPVLKRIEIRLERLLDVVIIKKE